MPRSKPKKAPPNNARRATGKAAAPRKRPAAGKRKHAAQPNAGDAAQLLRYLKGRDRAAFLSADSTRLNANWLASAEDINVVLARELPTLRKRSRWLARNNPYAASAITVLQNYCIGVGFSLQMRVSRPVRTAEGFERVELDAFNDYVEDKFNSWGHDVDCCAPIGSPVSFFDFMEVMFRTLAIDGECFIHYVFDKSKGNVPLQLELVDAASVTSTRTEYEGRPICMGIEIDPARFRPVAYHVSKDARYSARRSERIDAADMLHIFRPTEARQLRGVPFLSVVSENLFQLSEYSNAQLIRNKIAAMFGVLFRGGDAKLNMGGSGSAEDTTDSDGWPVDANGNRITTLAPGLMGMLTGDSEPFMVNPTSPEGTYEAFLKSHLIATGAGVQTGISYPLLTRDTSDTTFASGRQSENMDTQGFRPLMRFFSRRGLSPIVRKWFDYAVLSGVVDQAPSYDTDPAFWTAHEWMPGGWSRGINPLQEVNASAKSMQEGITTLADECARYGLDWKTQLRLKAKIERFARNQQTTVGSTPLTDEQLAEMMQETVE